MKVRIIYVDVENGPEQEKIIENVHEIHYNFDCKYMANSHTAFESSYEFEGEVYNEGWNIQSDRILEMEVTQ